MDAPTEIFPFRYFDSIRGRWVTARYKATRQDIAARYEMWEITGPGEVRAWGSSSRRRSIG
jgi:hypothetical protein